MKHAYANKSLTEAVETSYSFRTVLIKLGIIPAGGNYQTIKKRIKELNLSTSHFTGKGWGKNRKLGFHRPLEDYLSNDVFITSHKLKLRLLSEKLFTHRCYNCRRKTWLKKPIPLELEHIDGNSTNNNLSNITLLCPNCHAQTSTYRGKNIPLKKLRSVLPELEVSPNLTPFI